MNRLSHWRTTLALAACTAGAALAAGGDSAATAATAPRSVAHPGPQSPPPPPPAAPAVTNVFAATSWQPAPPPPAPAPSPAPVAAAAALPVAPPLPFRFLGRYVDAGVQVVMLVKGEQLYLVAVGDTIDQAYRVDRVSGTTVELTYLPLQLKQSLSTGDAG
jgi:hypothetical protein